MVMRVFFSLTVHLAISQALALLCGGWMQYTLTGQIGMTVPFGSLLLICFCHQCFLSRRSLLPEMPSEIRTYLYVAVLWSAFVLSFYGCSQYHRLDEIWIVLPILFVGLIVLDLVLLLCCQEVVKMICPPSSNALTNEHAD